jgi:hypothetical protein
MDRATASASQRMAEMGRLAPGGQPRQQRRTRQDEENGTGRQGGMFSTFLIIMEKGFAGIIGK